MSRIKLEGEVREISLAKFKEYIGCVQVAEVKWALLEWRNYTGK